MKTGAKMPDSVEVTPMQKLKDLTYWEKAYIQKKLFPWVAKWTQTGMVFDGGGIKQDAQRVSYSA